MNLDFFDVIHFFSYNFSQYLLNEKLLRAYFHRNFFFISGFYIHISSLVKFNSEHNVYHFPKLFLTFQFQAHREPMIRPRFISLLCVPNNWSVLQIVLRVTWLKVQCESWKLIVEENEYIIILHKFRVSAQCFFS